MDNRETIIKKCQESIDSGEPPMDYSFYYRVIELLKEQPKQKHGHWVSVPDKSPKTTTINMYTFIYSCSECGKAVGHHAEYNYCPGCGAIMTWMVNQDES